MVSAVPFFVTLALALAIAALEIRTGMRGPDKAEGWELAFFTVLGAMGLVAAAVTLAGRVSPRPVVSAALSAFYVYVGLKGRAAPKQAFDALAVLGILKFASVALAVAVLGPRVMSESR
jgi:hypothetical protein